MNKQYDIFEDNTPVWRLVIGLARRYQEAFKNGQTEKALYYADLSKKVEDAASVFQETDPVGGKQ